MTPVSEIVAECRLAHKNHQRSGLTDRQARKSVGEVMADDPAQLQLHIEPQEPIEVYELTAALSALSRQYNLYVDRQRYFEKAGDARLLVSSVSPGSIDINFVPDLSSAIAFAAPIEHCSAFTQSIAIPSNNTRPPFAFLAAERRCPAGDAHAPPHHGPVRVPTTGIARHNVAGAQLLAPGCAPSQLARRANSSNPFR